MITQFEIFESNITWRQQKSIIFKLRYSLKKLGCTKVSIKDLKYGKRNFKIVIDYPRDNYLVRNIINKIDELYDTFDISIFSSEGLWLSTTISLTFEYLETLLRIVQSDDPLEQIDVELKMKDFNL